MFEPRDEKFGLSPSNSQHRDDEVLGLEDDREVDFDFVALENESDDEEDTHPAPSTGGFSPSLGIADFSENDETPNDEDERGVEESVQDVVWFADVPIDDEGDVGLGPEDASGIVDWDSEHSEDDEETDEKGWADYGLDLLRYGDDSPSALEATPEDLQEGIEGEDWHVSSEAEREVHVVESMLRWEPVSEDFSGVELSDVTATKRRVIAVGLSGGLVLDEDLKMAASWNAHDGRRAWVSIASCEGEQGRVILATASSLYVSTSSLDKVAVVAGASPGRASFRQVFCSRNREQMALALSDDGNLWASVDDGLRWHQVRGTGKVLGAAWGHGVGAAVLTERGSEWRLLRSPDGSSWDSTPVQVGGHTRVSARRVFVAVLGEQVALVDQDGRAVFQEVDGAWSAARGVADRVTCAMGAVLESGPVLFVAEHDESDDRARILAVSPAGSAQVVAEIDTGDDKQVEQGVEVVSLHWDGYRHVLWAVGPFGLRGWRAPQTV